VNLLGPYLKPTFRSTYNNILEGQDVRGEDINQQDTNAHACANFLELKGVELLASHTFALLLLQGWNCVQRT